MNATCLICGEATSPEGSGFGKVGCSDSSNTSCLKHEVSIILLLRKVLGISQAHIVSLLRKNGNPSSWGVRLCSPCNRVFIEAEFIHERLQKLHADFDELANNLRKQLEESRASLSVAAVPETTDGGRRRKKRGRKKRVRFSNTPSGLDTQDPSECIRHEFFKCKREAVSLPVKTDPLQCSSTGISTRGQKALSTGIVKLEITDSFSDQDCLLDENLHIIDNSKTDEDVVAPETAEPVPETLEQNDSPEPVDDDDYLPDGNDDDDDKDYECDTEKKKKIAADTDSEPKTDKVDIFSCPQPVKLENGYKCPVCGRKALSKSSSYGHILRAHYNEEKPFHCHLCTLRFRRDVQLRQHLEDEHDSATTPLDDPDERQRGESTSLCIPTKVKTRKFQCDLCPKTKYTVMYMNLETLEAHKKLKHLGVKRPYSCKVCDKSFKLYSMLRHHMYVHQRQEKEKVAKERPFCAECNRTFKNMGSLTAHFRTRLHAKPHQYPYQCELCPKGFFQKPSLDNHQSHEHYEELNIQPFKCTFCENVLSGKRALDHHVRIRHTKDTLYRCEPCDLGFMFTYTYNRHMTVVHEKEKALLCSYCPKRFASKNHLETHLRVHTGEKPYKCPHCVKEYSDRPTYRRHLETHGDTVYQCSICNNRSFKIWHSYRLHMKTHNQEVHKKPPPNIGCNDTAAQIKNDDDPIVQYPQKADTAVGENQDLNTSMNVAASNISQEISSDSYSMTSQHFNCEDTA